MVLSYVEERSQRNVAQSAVSPQGLSLGDSAPRSSTGAGYVLQGHLRLIPFGRFLLRPSSPTSARAPPNVWPTWDLRGKQPRLGPCDDRCEPGPGRFGPAAGRRPRHEGRDAVAPAQLIASYALRAAGTSPGLYDFLQPRNALPVRRVEPGAWPGVCRNPGSLSPPEPRLPCCSISDRLRLARMPAPHPFWMNLLGPDESSTPLRRNGAFPAPFRHSWFGSSPSRRPRSRPRSRSTPARWSASAKRVPAWTR